MFYMIWDIINFLATVFSGIFLVLLVFQVYIFFLRRERVFENYGYFPSVTVLVPCHNEGKHLRKTLRSILESGYPGKLEVWVLDDGSTDESPRIARWFRRRGVKYIRTEHIGKANALNNALKRVETEIVMTVDGDTEIGKGTIEKMVSPFQDPRIGATTGVIKVRISEKKPITWFQRVEYLGFVFYKRVCNKLESLIVSSGPLSAYRVRDLKFINGFNPCVFSEDIDVSLRLIKIGKKIWFVKDSVSWTQVPESLGELARQRLRWFRGGIHVLKSHFNMCFNPRYRGAGFFSIPFMLYSYFHSSIMGIILGLQILLGYQMYFYSQGVLISWEVVKYFFYWFSVFGIVNLAYNMWVGVFPVTPLNIINILIVILNYIFFGTAVKCGGERFGWRDGVVFIFLFPYWLLLMGVQVLANFEWLKGREVVKWKK